MTVMKFALTANYKLIFCVVQTSTIGMVMLSDWVNFVYLAIKKSFLEINLDGFSYHSLVPIHPTLTE